MSERQGLVTALLCAAGLLGLGACASLNEKECRAGDWAAIGQRDGQQGYPASRLDAHREACQPYGIQPDAVRWRATYAAGLLSYCTPLNGLEVGRRGWNYQGACPAALEPAFLAAWRVGYDEARIRTRLEWLESQASSLRARLGRLGPGRERDMTLAELHRLDGFWFSEISDARNALWRAQDRSAAYRNSLQTPAQLQSAPGPAPR